MAEYARESVMTCWEELQPLFRLHDQEVPIIKGGFEADKDLVMAWVDAGITRFYTVRVIGVLVGYAGFLVHSSVMKKGRKEADSVLLFVHPHHRRHNVGNGLLNYAEADLATEVDQINYSMPTREHGVHSLLLTRGCTLVEYGFSKELT